MFQSVKEIYREYSMEKAVNTRKPSSAGDINSHPVIASCRLSGILFLFPGLPAGDNPACCAMDIPSDSSSILFIIV